MTWRYCTTADFGRHVCHAGAIRMLRCLAASALVFGLVFSSSRTCVSAPKGREILVSAAISLKNAFEEIGALFEKQTGVRVNFNLGASGLLQRQIETGAPVDIFASAGEKQMDELQSRGFILAKTRRNFARNTLVLIIPTRSPVPIHSFADLAHPRVGKVAIGNPKTVPAGQYARDALIHLKIWDGLQSRLVLAENVRQVLDYVVRGEVDAGLVYASDVPAAHGEAVVAARAPDGSHSPILYPIAVVKGTISRSDAQRFIDLTRSRAGQAVLSKHGFSSSQ
jgi:molybdate transport system substrate-binding protein